MAASASDPIRIFYSTDDGYAYPVAVSMWSVLRHSNRPIEFHVIALDVSESSLKLWHGVTATNANAVLKIETLPESMRANSEMRPRLPTLARLLIPHFVLPDRRAIYVDADTVAVRDVGELHDVDLGDALLGGIKNLRVLEKYSVARSPLAPFYAKTVAAAKREGERLQTEVEGIAPDQYINAGVFVLNLPVLAKEPALIEKLSDIETAFHKKQFDQDWLCCTFKGRIRYVHPRWNCYSNLGRANLWAFDAADRQGFIEAKADPGIVHFVGTKPWASKGMKQFGVGHQWRELWRRTAREMNAALSFQLPVSSPFSAATDPGR